VGVNAFIPKPVQINELQLALQTHVVPTALSLPQPEMAHA
jgi:hypothetical protein